MLKIKDNVDLKELEKFGFQLEKCFPVYIKEINYRSTCYINCESDRHIWLGVDDICNELDILYDLIQAGLVEKVEGESK